MEDDNNLCEICLESFNNSHKIPKLLDCCKQSFCLSCLKDIYRLNKDRLICPICRKITYKNPTDLKINKEKLEPCLICPACQTGTTQADLRIKVSQKGLSLIVCGKCSPDSYSAHRLSEYLTNVADEMNFFIDSFCNIRAEAIEDVVDFQLNNCVDSLLLNLTKRIKSKIKSKIMHDLCEQYELIASSNNLSNVFRQFEQFKENYELIVKMSKVNMKNKDYIPIKSLVDYYINNSENIKKNGLGLKRINENINNNNVVTFNKMMVDCDDVENLLENFFEVKVNSERKNLMDKKYSLSECENFNTGVKFIDEKFSQLKKENENLYQNFLKGDLQIKKLERELAEIRNNINNSEKEKCKNCLIPPDKNKSFNHYPEISNLNLNDIEFNIIPCNELNKNSKFDNKNLFLQNFNFSIPSKIKIYTQNSFSNEMNINNFRNSNSNETIRTEFKMNINTIDDLEEKLFNLECID